MNLILYTFSIFFISISALFLAYFAEHIWGLEPCSLCLYERIPYGISAGASLLSLTVPIFRKYLPFLCTLIFLSSSFLGGYHVGVEWKIFAPPLSCASSKNFKGLSISEMEKAIMRRPVVRCDQVNWRILSRSAAEWNFGLYLGLLLISGGMLWSRRR